MHSDGLASGPEAKPLPHDRNCLCCCHFAVDLESSPEAFNVRPARRPKRRTVVGEPVLSGC